MRILRIATVGVVLLTGGTVISGGQRGGGTLGQQGGTPHVGSGMPGMPPIGSNPDDGLSRLEDMQARARNTDRQKRLVQDTEKLLSLATDLKQQVDKTNSNILSVDVVKKAEEIEKLAKSVKERMKG